MAIGHTNGKRKRNSTSAAPEPNLLTTYMTNYKISITNSQQDKIRFFNKCFKDPPHYNQLLTGRGPSPTPLEPPQVASGDNSSGDDDSDDDNSSGDGEREEERHGNIGGRGEASTSVSYPPTKTYRSLVFSENMRDDNRARAFLALKFLRDRLRHKARLEDRNFTFRIVRGGVTLRQLAHDIVVDMPTLAGITGNALFALFTTMIWSYRVFRHITQRWTGGEPPESTMFVMAGELSQIDIEVTERLQRKAVDKETEIREEAAKARRALVASTSLMKDSQGRTRKTPRSSQTHVVAHQGTSQSSGSSSTHRGRPFHDQDDEEYDSQTEYDRNNVIDDVSTNDNSSFTLFEQSPMVRDMAPTGFLTNESDRDDVSSRASIPLMSPPPPVLRSVSVAMSVGSTGSYSRGPYNKKHQQGHPQQQPNVSILDNIKTSISELDAKMEQMAQKIAGAISGMNTAIKETNTAVVAINARLDELSKGQMGENGVSLKSLQYSTQKELEKLEKRVNSMTEYGPTASRRISPGADIGSHEYPYN
ncbi:hypothetical protein BGX24_001543, partial [Mortierella sp. AD032]